MLSHLNCVLKQLQQFSGYPQETVCVKHRLYINMDIFTSYRYAKVKSKYLFSGSCHLDYVTPLETRVCTVELGS